MHSIDKVIMYALKHIASKHFETQCDVDAFLADVVLTIGYNDSIEYTDKELYTALLTMGITQDEISRLRDLSVDTIERAINQ